MAVRFGRQLTRPTVRGWQTEKCNKVHIAVGNFRSSLKIKPTFATAPNLKPMIFNDPCYRMPEEASESNITPVEQTQDDTVMPLDVSHDISPVEKREASGPLPLIFASQDHEEIRMFNPTGKGTYRQVAVQSPGFAGRWRPLQLFGGSQ
jgi:hypothetical protein